MGQSSRLFHTVEADFKKDLVRAVDRQGGEHKEGIWEVWRKAGQKAMVKSKRSSHGKIKEREVKSEKDFENEISVEDK